MTERSDSKSSPVYDNADDILRSIADKLKKKKQRPVDLFKQTDASSDAMLSATELRSELANIGYKPSDKEFHILLLRIDPDGTGEVCVKEFDRAIKSVERLSTKQSKDPPAKKRQGLSAEDKEEFRQIFCLFKQLCRARGRGEDGGIELVEWDDSGSISVDELETLLETVGLRLDPSQLEIMVKEIDLDGNGEIDFSEFCETMTKKIQVDYQPDEIAKSFKAFAKNAPEGMIRVSDLRNALKTYMHKDLIDAEVDALLLHYTDCYVKLPGQEHEYFNYQDYVDLMTPMVERGSCSGE